jgi:hypothetical protein
MPTLIPSLAPTDSPSLTPSAQPSTPPSPLPSTAPSMLPTIAPTLDPSEAPSSVPTVVPTPAPSALPTMTPTANPSEGPTVLPSPAPSLLPAASPSAVPSAAPTSAPSAAPQAGVTVVPPTNNTLPENGDASVTFSVVLDAAPLSPVTVTFSSSPLAFVSFDPAFFIFDRTNFATPVDVAITAVDDSIDYGVSRSGSVNFTVTSDDSLSECEAAGGSSPCGQAVGYDGFVVETIVDLVVVDDDVAALTLSASTAAATYDNYGDALAPAVYMVSLATEPRGDVEVMVGSDGGASASAFATLDYAVATPATLTFTAANWAEPQAVSVAASAPSADRPVCHSGNRYCERLVSSVLSCV